jgi:hypothetical protein
MLWSELNYTDQLKIINRILDLCDQENNLANKIGLLAAVNELEIWSNSPCYSFDEMCVVSATDPE